MPSLTRILCPIDFSDTSRSAVECALALARWHEARLTVLHVFDNVLVADAIPVVDSADVPPPLTLKDVKRDALLAEMRAFVGPAAREFPTELLLQEAPDVRTEILADVGAFQVDLIVMGSRGRTGMPRLLLGSVADAVLRQASCPVLVVPHMHPARRCTYRSSASCARWTSRRRRAAQ